MSAGQMPRIARVSGVGYRGEVVAGSALEQLLRAGDVQSCLALQSEGATVLKREPHACSAVIHRLGTTELDQPIFCKQHERRGLIGLVKSLAGRHRARTAWIMSWRMIAVGVPVPRPIGYLLIRPGASGVKSIYFCEAMNEYSHLRDVIGAGQRPETDASLLDALAHVIATMHNAGIVHGDLKWTNILVNRADQRFWLVDLDGAQVARSSRATMRDLARFVGAAHEAALDESLVEQFQQRYALKRGLTGEQVKRGIEPAVAGHLERRKRIAGRSGRG